MMDMEYAKKLLERLDPVRGQKLVSVRARDNDVWLVFEDDIVQILFPRIEVRCLGCVKDDKN